MAHTLCHTNTLQLSYYFTILLTNSTMAMTSYVPYYTMYIVTLNSTTGLDVQLNANGKYVSEYVHSFIYSAQLQNMVIHFLFALIAISTMATVCSYICIIYI